MNRNILEHYGKINATNLHSSGDVGTEQLLQELGLKDGENVLEVGFGTGGTLVKVRARYPLVNLYGIDSSAIMFERSLSRLRFCGLRKGTSLFNVQPGQKFPFNDGLFDRIYAESVFGIQEGPQLKAMLSEVLRVLKPNGSLVTNETVWLPEITRQEIENINRICKNAFGIIQASADYPTRGHWLQLFETTGFTKSYSKPIDHRTIKDIPKSKGEILSGMYTFMGILKNLHPRTAAESRAFEKSMGNIFGNKRYLEGVLFVAIK